MKILVTAKRVTDPDVKIKVKPDGTGIVTEGMTYKVNPFDEIAVTQALSFKDKAPGSEVVVVGIGPKETSTIIRGCLALGADRGVHVLCDAELDSSILSEILEKVYQKEKPDFVLMGKQAVDDDSNQAAQMLASRMGIPQACFASKIELMQGNKVARVTREVDGGLEVIDVNLPAVLTADLRLCEPGYASVMGIMKAKKKPIEELPIASLGLDLTPRVKVHRLSAPPVRKAGIKVPDVATLVEKLRTEAKVV